MADQEADLVKFDFTKTVRDRMRAMFADVIPDDELSRLMTMEIRGFFADERTGGHYGSRNEIVPHSSPFAKMVRAETEAYIKADLVPKIQKQTEALIEEKGIDHLLVMIGEAKAKYEATVLHNTFQTLIQSLPYTIQNVITEHERNKR